MSTWSRYESLSRVGGFGLASAPDWCWRCLQARVDEVYKDQRAWTRMSVMSTAGSGKFSSDRTISEYAADIWDVKPCPVPAPEV